MIENPLRHLSLGSDFRQIDTRASLPNCHAGKGAPGNRQSDPLLKEAEKLRDVLLSWRLFPKPLGNSEDDRGSGKRCAPLKPELVDPLVNTLKSASREILDALGHALHNLTPWQLEESFGCLLVECFHALFEGKFLSFPQDFLQRPELASRGREENNDINLGQLGPIY
jgi:hypothetical protein